MSDVVDLFDLAKNNDPRLEENFQRLLETASEAARVKLREFATLVEHSGFVSLNLRIVSLLAFLDSGRQWNVFEWAEAESEVSGREADDHLRERLGVWYPKRTAFEDSFVGGREFHYGALNIGGLGAKRYGTCCAVTLQRFLDRERLVFLHSDSLRDFVDEHARVLHDVLRVSVASKGSHHHLAATKHAEDCPESGDWHRMLCSSAGYVEAIFRGSATVDELGVVRFPKSEYDEIQDLTLGILIGDTVKDADRIRVTQFGKLTQQLETRSIPLEVL